MKLKLAALVFAGATLLSAQGKLAGGPYAINVSARAATIAWLIEDSALILRGPTGAPKTSPALRVEKTTLTGLLPNTRYEYEIPGHPGVKGSFKTAAGINQPYQFVIYGDNRTRADIHKRVIDTLLKTATPDFIIQSGDMVENGFDTSLWPIFFDIEKDLLRRTAFFPALGNHERDCKNFFDYFEPPNPYYSFNWGNAHFTIMSSDIANSAPTKTERDALWAEQVKWLEADLAANQNMEFRFVTAHHPPFSAVARRQEESPHMKALVPLFEKYKVTAGFFGHDHNYQHYLKNGVQYIVEGGGGAPLYDVDAPDKSIVQKVVSVEGFVTVSVNGKIAKLTAIDIDGKTIDEFEIRH